jgi:hypothetical protein
MSQLRSAVQLLLRHTNLPDLDHAAVLSPNDSLKQTDECSPANLFSDAGSSAMSLPSCLDLRRDSTVEPDLFFESGLATVPVAKTYHLSSIQSLSNSKRCSPVPHSPEGDFVARGLVPMSEAENLFARYMLEVRQNIWGGILFPYESLEVVRLRSPLLTAAVLTIAALQTGHEDVMKRCYEIFVALATNTSLSRPHNIDDVRAQALGAFYLPDLSWKLSGLAVRNAVELNLHQSYQKLMRGNENHRDKVRLWYALYVCEHQCSIAHGRPPTIHHDVAIRNVEAFLDSPNTLPGDIELCAQVSLFKILTEAYNTYGSDPEHCLTESDLHQLRLFNLAIDDWGSCWEARSVDSHGVGAEPPNSIVLHRHFVRVHLNSLALRALRSLSSTSFESLSYERLEAANVAIAAAISTLILILDDTNVNNAMPTVPVFTRTMVGFCAMFLLKTIKAWSSVAQAHPLAWSPHLVLELDLDVNQIFSLVRRSADFLTKSAGNFNEGCPPNGVAQDINDILNELEGMGTAISTRASSVAGSGFLRTNDGVAMATGCDVHELRSFNLESDDSFLERLSSTNLDFWDVDPLC